MNAPINTYSPHFQILAFPCDQFGLQEPGRNPEILNGIKYVRPGGGFEPQFPVFGKTHVNGQNEHPLFTFLKHSCPPTSDLMADPTQLFYAPIRVTDITWNFEKFLIGSDGKPRFRFHPSVDPDVMSPWIEELIKDKFHFKF